MPAAGKIIVLGEVELLSPALIGCGKDDRTEMDVIRDSKGNPFIPASALIGVLRHKFGVNTERKENPDGNERKFWGYTKDDKGQQSAFACSDLLHCTASSPQVAVRDGIKIDARTGVVVDMAKYDYEVVEPGARFGLSMEVTLDDNRDSDFSKYCCKAINTIVSLLQKGEIRVGAKTNNGLGKLKLVRHGMYDFDFSEKDDVLKWLTWPNKKYLHQEEYPQGSRQCSHNENDSLPFVKPDFTMNIRLRVKGSLLVRSYSDKLEDPDAVHIMAHGKYVLPGSSWKGPLRHRAERILRTLGKKDTVVDTILHDLFGHVDDGNVSKSSNGAKNKKVGEAKKGRLRIEESEVPGLSPELQTRIKIDRFTGGTIQGALLEEMPLFSGSGDNHEIALDITVSSCQPHEAGLLLLLLKDLWTGDLAVGGGKAVGRGVFEGIGACIDYRGERYIFDENFSALRQDTEKKKKLENLVKGLSNGQE